MKGWIKIFTISVSVLIILYIIGFIAIFSQNMIFTELSYEVIKGEIFESTKCTFHRTFKPNSKDLAPPTTINKIVKVTYLLPILIYNAFNKTKINDNSDKYLKLHRWLNKMDLTGDPVHVSIYSPGISGPCDMYALVAGKGFERRYLLYASGEVDKDEL